MRLLPLALILFALGACSGASSSLTVEDGGGVRRDDSIFQPLRVADFDVRTGNRFYVASVLESVFGTDQELYGDFPGSPKPEPIRLYIRERMSAFGGPCTNQEDMATRSVSSGGHVMRPGNSGCFFSDFDVHGNVANPDSQVKSFVPPNTLASAWVHQACSFLLGVQAPNQLHSYVDRALNNAVRCSRGQAAGAAVDYTQPLTRADLDGAYSLFFPGRQPSAEAVAALDALVQQASTATYVPDPRIPSTGIQNRETWRFVVLTLCQSGLWMAP